MVPPHHGGHCVGPDVVTSQMIPCSFCANDSCLLNIFSKFSFNLVFGYSVLVVTAEAVQSNLQLYEALVVSCIKQNAGLLTMKTSEEYWRLK